MSLEAWTTRFVQLEERGLVWKDRVYAQLCLEFGLKIEAPALLEEYELGFAEHVRPCKDLVLTLGRLKAEDYRLGVITNGRAEFQRRTIAALDIEPLLDVLLISEECGIRKPDKAIFHLALDQIECAAAIRGSSVTTFGQMSRAQSELE